MAGTGANALGGAATGAAAGSVFGPIGSGIGAGLGGLLGLFSGDDGEEKLQRDIKAMRARLQQQQAMIPGARSQALGQELGAYAPANEMLGRMYGSQAMVDPSKLTQSPVPVGMYGPPPKPGKYSEQYNRLRSSGM